MISLITSAEATPADNAIARHANAILTTAGV
jgi:hypothetical protein